MRAASVPLFLALLLTIAGCAPAPGSTGRSEPQNRFASGAKRVTAGIPATPPILYNALNVGGVGGQGSALQDLVHVGLAAHDPQSNLHPRLAEAVPSLENGLWRLLADGRMETTWRIRAGAQWHDGTPFTSADAAFTLQVVGDRELPALGNVAYASIEGVDTPDARTVTVRWNKPYIEADRLFTASLAAPLPRHLLERPLAESKATFLDLPYWGPEFIGTGPFWVREFERGSHLLVGAFDRFVFGRPKVDFVEVRFVSDESTLVANLLAGAIELTLARAISAEQGAQLREQWREGRVASSVDDWYILYPQNIGATPPAVADPQFRRAIMHATDRQQMADTLEGGLSSVVHAPVGPKEREYADVEGSIVRYDYDPRRAIQIIEGLGYVRAPDGIFRDAAGQRLEVEVNTTRLDTHQKMLLALNDQWPRAGVAVDPVVIPPQRAQDAEYRATFPGMALQGHPREVIRFHGSEARLAEKGYRGGNNARYINAELDALIDRYFVTVPKAERNQVLAQIVRHISEQVVVLPMIWRVDPTAIGNRLTNIEAKGPQATQTWNAHDWEAN
jgi:peptide/nickel transport system substrate-binding protein